MTDTGCHGSRTGFGGAEPGRGGEQVVEAAAREEVVVLDYGGQYSQLIARRVRDCGVFSELLPHHVGLEEVAQAQAARHHPLRRPRVGVRPGSAAPGARAARARRAGARHLLRHAAARPRARRARRAGRGGRVRPLRPARLRARRAAGRDAQAADLLDVPPRHRLRGAGRASPRSPPPPPRPWPRSRTPSAASTASSSTPRSSTRPTARRSSRGSSPRSAAASAPGRRLRSPKTRSRGSAGRWGTGASSAGSRAAWTPRWRRCSCTARSATSSRACSSTTA